MYKYAFLLEPHVDGTLSCSSCWDLPCPCSCPEVPPNPQEPDDSQPATKKHRTQRFQGRVVVWNKGSGSGDLEIDGMVERPVIDWKDCDRCVGCTNFYPNTLTPSLEP